MIVCPQEVIKNRRGATAEAKRLRKFKELPVGDVIAGRIAAFNRIRDLPFFVATRMGEDDCCCSTKAVLLERELSALGLQCRHVLCYFKWEKLNLPESLLAIPHEPLPSHQFLEVLIPDTGKWTMVDPTWDSGIGSVVPVNEWDGVSDTPCAVTIERRCDAEETRTIFAACETPELIRQYFSTEGAFLEALNRYLEGVRASGS